jgi:putative DNA primase/helicase
MNRPERPVTSPVVETNIPAILKPGEQWVVWSWTWNADKEKWDKPPLCARDGRSASVTDSRTWSTFANAIRFHHAGHVDGVGFVLTDQDPFVGVDLDKCIVGGVIERWAQEIIDRLGSYTEFSPSGRGIRILCRGTLPPKGRRKGLIEMYCTGRYVTITGHRVPNAPFDTADRTAELATLHAKVFASEKRPAASRQTTVTGAATADDAELIERAKAAANGGRFAQLWAGDTSSYSSASEADQALVSMLAFWAGSDTERIDRLFRASALCRDKWLEREDYRASTIARALERGQFYEPPRRSVVHRAGCTPRRRSHHVPNATRCGLKPIRLSAAEGRV